MDCNFEDNYFRSMDGRPLEARNLPFRNAFSFISIRFLIPKISSCKEKDNFASAFLRKNIDHWPIHNRLKYYGIFISRFRYRNKSKNISFNGFSLFSEWIVMKMNIFFI